MGPAVNWLVSINQAEQKSSFRLVVLELTTLECEFLIDYAAEPADPAVLSEKYNLQN